MRRGALLLLTGLVGLPACCGWAEQYTAFSLKVAQQRIEAAGQGWREREPEVLSLGGITRVEGFVYDQPNVDLILVGDQDETRADLTLDDLVVALRARFIYGEWPLVSIDPTPDTLQTEMLNVRWEGGIQDTALGLALFEADYRLKEMGMGLAETGVPGLRTCWDRDVEEADNGSVAGDSETCSRLWFYPISPHVAVREGVCVARGLKLGVFTEVMSATIDGKAVEDVKGLKSATNEAWATDVTERFDDLCRAQPSLNRLRGLQELVAVSKALEETEDLPDLTWWLTQYPVTKVQTPEGAGFLRRDHKSRQTTLKVSGGVHLTALAMRLRAGDVTALRGAVLATRPRSDSPTWGFVVAEWVIPIAPGMVNAEAAVPLVAQAVFLRERGRPDDALALYQRILEAVPECAEAWCGRGAALGDLGRYQEALTCFDAALKIHPGLPEAWYDKGAALEALAQHQEAVACFDHALETNPRLAEAWYGRGAALGHLGRDQDKLQCLDRALELNPRYAEAWSDKAAALGNLGRHEEALASCDRALEIDPRDLDAWCNKGAALGALGRYQEEVASCDRALEINPRDALAWCNKGAALGALGRYQEQVACCDRALAIDPRYAEAWSNKGVALGHLGRREEQMLCYDRALDINPRLPDVWYNKGLALADLDRYEEAMACYGRALEINPRLPDAWCRKGGALGSLGRYQEALVCFDRELGINPRHPVAWYNKGVALLKLERYTEARAAIERAKELGQPDAARTLDIMRQAGH